MKRLFTMCVLLASLASLQAQTLQFGYFSYAQVLQSMPTYQQAQSQLTALRAQYEQELQTAQQEFTAKYEAFLEGQNTFAPSIRNKRQAELEQLVAQNEAFRNEAARLLQQAENEALDPIRQRIQIAVQYIGEEHKLAFILNTDDNNAPFVDPKQGMDLTPILIERLK